MASGHLAPHRAPRRRARALNAAVHARRPAGIYRPPEAVVMAMEGVHRAMEDARHVVAGQGLGHAGPGRRAGEEGQDSGLAAGPSGDGRALMGWTPSLERVVHRQLPAPRAHQGKMIATVALDPPSGAWWGALPRFRRALVPRLPMAHRAQAAPPGRRVPRHAPS
jgi:hypothetical protein